MTPYDYQLKAFNDIIEKISHGFRAPICQLPTRAGKSIVAKLLIDYFETTYFIAHKKILITQMSDELTENGIKHGIIAPWAPQLRYKVQVISKDTFFNRVDHMQETGWKAPQLIIIDECHMALGKRYKEILEKFPTSIIVGLSATPIRLSGEPMGDIFDSIVIGPSIKELQKKRRLCPVETFAVDFDDSGLRVKNGEYVAADVLARVDKPSVLKDIVYWWEKVAKNKKTLTFCASIKHAEDMAQQFNEMGYPTVCLSSKNTAQEIKEKLNKYYSGEYINLVSVDLFTMGFTVRECECIIQARPTQSLMIFMQSVGRGMIYLQGKTLINLDCVNNFTRHGLPDDDREWSLLGKSKKEKEISQYKKCPECFHPVPTRARVCEHCGFSWVEVEAKGSRMPKEKDGRLIKISRNDKVIEIARNCKTLEEALMIDPLDGENIWKNILKHA